MAPLGALLLAGGTGQRLWPLSRKNSPKQFAPLIGTKSSFQLAVERLAAAVPSERMYVATNRAYEATLRAQAPGLPARNFILEPCRRDVAAAVALAFFSLEKDGVSGPFMFQWSDNYVKNTDVLERAISCGRALVERDPQRMVFIGEKPRYASENLGWIELADKLGEHDGVPYYGFRSWQYRPPKARCEDMLASGNFVWNSGYFVTTVEFMTSAFRTLAPELSARVEEIVQYRGTPREQEKLEELYPKVPSLHFDVAILERLPKDQAVLISADLGWSDPGNLYSLKEALQDSTEASVVRGDVVELGTRDSFIYNLTGERLVAAMGLDGVIVVDTPEVLLVVHKDSVRHLGDLLKKLGDTGHERLL
ncbi:MAG TPA: sugar phosphate nucleotidyltransferase [Polyangiaceae bacterium]|jgi:mannose-1-phosphate guanylyltransferase|nr:sugar phosphate nucleotidyltransferase [Polyangiaceae bacterium]